jgi:hypothetical protein
MSLRISTPKEINTHWELATPPANPIIKLEIKSPIPNSNSILEINISPKEIKVIEKPIPKPSTIETVFIEKPKKKLRFLLPED